ncbi:MAG: phosphohistidine phosphatase SixA [Syntrophomonadaceae bacterium]|nr:phosphohistidine phosphatase SixA [Syntrophomonadaceae bacterium]
MSTELVLFRHGKAENASLDVEIADVDRALTPKGVQDLKKSLVNLKIFLKSQHKILIWSSPLLRATQTAELIAKQLKVKKITSFDFISTGDFTAFSDELGKVEDAVSLVVVGHEPYLSEWSQIISGCRLPFKKGAGAGFEIISTAPVTGELTWFMQPKILRRIDLDQIGGKK